MAPIRPSNWMGLSILSVIFCTLPFGIIALWFSLLVTILVLLVSDICFVFIVFYPSAHYRGAWRL